MHGKLGAYRRGISFAAYSEYVYAPHAHECGCAQRHSCLSFFRLFFSAFVQSKMMLCFVLFYFSISVAHLIFIRIRHSAKPHKYEHDDDGVSSRTCDSALLRLVQMGFMQSEWQCKASSKTGGERKKTRTNEHTRETRTTNITAATATASVAAVMREGRSGKINKFCSERMCEARKMRNERTLNAGSCKRNECDTYLLDVRIGSHRCACVARRGRKSGATTSTANRFFPFLHEKQNDIHFCRLSIFQEMRLSAML